MANLAPSVSLPQSLLQACGSLFGHISQAPASTPAAPLTASNCPQAPSSAPTPLAATPQAPRQGSVMASKGTATRGLYGLQGAAKLSAGEGDKKWYSVSEAKDLDNAGWKPTAKMPRKFFVGGNWKCNGTRESLQTLSEALNKGESIKGSGVEVMVAPPAAYADYTRYLLRPDFSVGYQNCWTGPGGAFTGEVSADMIKDSFAESQWVILGHSERRSLKEIKETDETVAIKTAYALSKGLGVMLCIGETLAERDAGQTAAVNERQLAAVAKHVTDWSNVVIAYEPVWAIGTGKVATPEQAQEVHADIRKWLSQFVSPKVAAETRILYGGSVNGANCHSLAKKPDVDGFLVGGASLKPEFLKIVDSWKAKLEM